MNVDLIEDIDFDEEIEVFCDEETQSEEVFIDEEDFSSSADGDLLPTIPCIVFCNEGNPNLVEQLVIEDKKELKKKRSPIKKKFECRSCEKKYTRKQLFCVYTSKEM